MKLYSSVASITIMAGLAGCSATGLDDYAGALSEETGVRVTSKDASPAGERPRDAGRLDVSTTAPGREGRPPKDAGRVDDATAGTRASARDAAADREKDASTGKDSSTGRPSGGLDPATLKVMKAFEDQFALQAALICSCFAPYGFDEEAQCVEAQMKVALIGNPCVEDALMIDEKASRTFFACTTDASGAVTDCLQEEPECSEETARRFEACSMRHADQYAACGALQVEIADALTPCRVLR